MLELMIVGLFLNLMGMALPRSDGSTSQPLKFISRNETLKKFRVVLELREGGMMEVFQTAGAAVTKAELGSFFLKERHKNFAKFPE